MKQFDQDCFGLYYQERVTRAFLRIGYNWAETRKIVLGAPICDAL